VSFQISDQGPLLHNTAWSSLPIARRTESFKTFNRLTERFPLFKADAMIEGDVTPLDPSIAAELVAAMINAASALKRWAPGMSAYDAVRLFAQSLFTGLLSPDAGAASKSTFA
jgi:hypothetical protein